MKLVSKSMLGGLLVLCGLAIPAVAADVIIEEVPSVEAAVTSTWTGFYVGAGVGYHWGDVEFEDCVGLCPEDPELDGWGAGVQAGYDYQFSNNVVLGAFVAIPLLGPEDSFEVAPGIEFDYETKFMAIFGGRVGYAVGNVLPYVHAGYHVAKVEADGPDLAPVDKVENTHHGYQVGVGLEWMFTEHISTDFRYSYSDSSEEEYDFGGGASNWSETGSTISAAVNFRF